MYIQDAWSSKRLCMYMNTRFMIRTAWQVLVDCWNTTCQHAELWYVLALGMASVLPGERSHITKKNIISFVLYLADLQWPFIFFSFLTGLKKSCNCWFVKKWGFSMCLETCFFFSLVSNIAAVIQTGIWIMLAVSWVVIFVDYLESNET